MNRKTSFFLFFASGLSLLSVVPLCSRNKRTKVAQRFLIEDRDLSSDAQFARWSKLFSQVFDIMHKKYYLPVLPQEAMLKAMDAFVSCDPHSSFLGEKELNELLDTTQGEVCGIGVVIAHKEPKDDALQIIEVLYDSPAEKAGIEAGDALVAIENELVQSLNMEEVAHKLKGKQHSTVKLTVVRGDILKECEVTRDIVKDEQLHAFFLPDMNIYYLSIASFNTQVYSDLKAVLQKIITKKGQGVILDLRNNSGGLLDSALDCLSLFLPKHSLVVSTKNRDNTVLEKFKTDKNPLRIASIPLVVLVNNLTASAAEIVAGSLRIFSQKQSFFGPVTPAVFIVGTQTFGKGSVQEIIPLTKNSALKLTTSLYYLADDSSIQSEGVLPDFDIHPKISVPQDSYMLAHTLGHEKSLKNALAHPTTDLKKSKKEMSSEGIEKKYAKKTSGVRRQEAIEHDYLIHQSLMLLNIFNITKACMPEKVKTHQQSVDFLKKGLVLTETIKTEELFLES